MISLNQTIKGARAAYFSNLIVNSNQFTTINQLVRPSPPAIHASSPADCEKFMSFLLARSAVQGLILFFMFFPCNIQSSYFTVRFCSYRSTNPFKTCQ